MGLEVRVVYADDWRVWRQLRLEALREAAYAFGSKLSEWQGKGDTESRWRGRLSRVAINLVAYLDGEAAGMVSGDSETADGTVELISMWVAPHARGRRVGDALVEAIVDWARNGAGMKIGLDVVESNVRAVTLYRRHRFIDVGAIECAAGVAVERRMVRDLR